MRHLLGQVPYLGANGFTRQRGKGRRANEVQRASGGNDADATTRLGQQAKQLHRFVCSDAACDPKNNKGPGILGCDCRLCDCRLGAP